MSGTFFTPLFGDCNECNRVRYADPSFLKKHYRKKHDWRNGTIGRYIEELADLDFLRHENHQYSVKIEKIVDEIEKFLAKDGPNIKREEKEILFHLLECKIVREHLRLMTSMFVRNGNTKTGGFLADLFTRLAIIAMSEIDQSRLEEGKPDLKKECQKLNQEIDEKELSTEFFTVDTLFRKLMVNLDIQYFKELKNYSNEEKLKKNKKNRSIDTNYLNFNMSYANKVFSLIPLELCEKMKFLNYPAASTISQITDRGRQFYVPVDEKMEKFILVVRDR